MNAPGVGLAANQIGILKQIVTIFFVNEETKKETSYELFNPRIVEYSKEKIYGRGLFIITRTVCRD